MGMKTLSGAITSAAMMLAIASAASAHHSYAMFDAERRVTVTGTVAKVEWSNPHVFIWVYVTSANGHDLYAFENGSTNALTRLGWTKSTLAPGAKISIEYSPLRDGRKGGHFIKAIHADGRVILGSGGPISVRDRAPAAAQGKQP